MTQVTTQFKEEQFVIVTPEVLQKFATEEESFKSVKQSSLYMMPAQLLLPIRLFEKDSLEKLTPGAQTQREIACMKAILDNPYRLVVQGAQTLEDGRQIDNRLILFDALENHYVDVVFKHETNEVEVLDSYYRNNEYMSPEDKRFMEDNLVRLLVRTAIATTHYLTHESSTVSTVQVKMMKSPFLTQRQRLMKNIYRNRTQTIHQFLKVDLSVDLLSDPSMKSDVVTSTIQAVEEVKAADLAQEVTLAASSEKAKAKKAKKTSSVKKAVKEEKVIEVLEDGTKIVQYERAGYWRTQRNKTTGEEKKIWIEPKLMTRKVPAE